jgi:hypothetical protein
MPAPDPEPLSLIVFINQNLKIGYSLDRQDKIVYILASKITIMLVDPNALFVYSPRAPRQQAQDRVNVGRCMLAGAAILADAYCLIIVNLGALVSFHPNNV